MATGSSCQLISSHRDLIVWQKSMDLVDIVYDLTDRFPKREYFALVPQISRSVVSVPANIAEGQARVTARDFANFLVIARSSLMETETLLTVAVRRAYAKQSEAVPAYVLITEISKMLTALRARILSAKRRS